MRAPHQEVNRSASFSRQSGELREQVFDRLLALGRCASEDADIRCYRLSEALAEPVSLRAALEAPSCRVCRVTGTGVQCPIVIDTALAFVTDQVNAHLLKRTGTELGAVETGLLVDERGNWAVTLDTTRLTLFQIDEERSLREQLPERTLVGGREVLLPPPLKLNLVLLFAGRFRQYDQALRTLSHILAFFQARPLFTASDSPGLPPGLERLALDLLSWGPEQLNQMWACLGAKHLPSVIYRLRLVALQDVEPVGSGLPITTIATALHGR